MLPFFAFQGVACLTFKDKKKTRRWARKKQLEHMKQPLIAIIAKLKEMQSVPTKVNTVFFSGHSEHRLNMAVDAPSHTSILANVLLFFLSLIL